VEPVPDHARTLKKRSDSLYIDDIEGARTKVTEFHTKRVVDPLCPKYILPSASEIVIDQGRKFLRDSLCVNDINGKNSCDWINQNKVYGK
jgi:hypothetical protein